LQRELHFEFQKECIECPSNCDTCKIDENGETKCSSCEIGYSFNKDKTCQSCSGECSSCEFDENDNPTTCLGCIEGYVLIPQNSCLACSSFYSSEGMEGFAQCLSCIRNEEIKDKEDYICTRCNPGYAIYQGLCKKCEEGCDSCEFDEKGNHLCSNCSLGYALNPDKKCVQCEEGCLSCQFDEKGNYIA